MVSNGRKLAWVVHVKKQLVHLPFLLLSFFVGIYFGLQIQLLISHRCSFSVSLFSPHSSKVLSQHEAQNTSNTSMPGSKTLFLYFFCIWVCLSESHHHPEQTTVIPPTQKNQRRKRNSRHNHHEVLHCFFLRSKHAQEKYSQLTTFFKLMSQLSASAF